MSVKAKIIVLVGAIGVSASLLATAPVAAAPALKPEDANVWVELTNKSDRGVSFTAFLARAGSTTRREVFTLEPGESYAIYGTARSGADVSAYAEWCLNEKCTDRSPTVYMKWSNPTINWPYMKVGDDKHGFKALERYTFVPAGDEGRIRFDAQRLTDNGNGTKRFVVEIRSTR